MNQTTTDPIFPPGNFHLWPITRTGALIIDALLLVLIIFLWVLPRIIYKKSRVYKTVGDMEHVSLFICCHFRFLLIEEV